MLATPPKQGEIFDHTLNNGFVANHPKCKFCGYHARPAYVVYFLYVLNLMYVIRILMFGDGNWVYKRKAPWSGWRYSAVKTLREDKNLRLVVLEIGAGKNVSFYHKTDGMTY